MAATTTEAGSSRSRLAAAASLACFVALATGIVVLGETGTADAVKAKEIGKTSNTPKPSCPTPNGPHPPRAGCQAFGEVTGFQTAANGKKGIMKVPAAGHIVGWSVSLSRPNKSERKFFEDVLGNRAFGGKPSARLALLSRATKTKYRLRAQSPAAKLPALLGRQQYFTLNQPIPVQKGWQVGLTSQTWTPNFAHDLPGNPGENVWYASRNSKQCAGLNNLTKKSRPHRKIGTTKVYGCKYDDARILYWAYFRPS